MNFFAQDGGEHYVDVRDNKILFKNKNGESLFETTDELSFLFREKIPFKFEKNKVYSGIIFWGVINIDDNGEMKFSKNWVMKTVADYYHGNVNRNDLGGMAFRSGSTIIMRTGKNDMDPLLRNNRVSRQLIEKNNLPHTAMWNAIFGREYKDFVSDNQIFICSAFTWRGPENVGVYAEPKNWVVRSASFQNTNMWRDLAEHMANETYATDDVSKRPDRFKRETEAFTALIKKSLDTLVNEWPNNLKKSLKSGVRWFRSSPDHNNCKLVKQNSEREIKDPFVLQTLERDYKRKSNKLPLPDFEVCEDLYDSRGKLSNVNYPF